MAPNSGARCADTAGGSSSSLVPAPVDSDEAEEEEEHLSRAANGLSASLAGAGSAKASDRSQMERRARPCATDARRPTVQMMAASRASSSARRVEVQGSRCPARTKGRVVEAYEEMERGRKAPKEAGVGAPMWLPALWWAR